MTRQITTKPHFMKAALSAVLILALFQALPILSTDSPNLSALENIHGADFPASGRSVVVTEQLAHADIYLNQAVLAKQLTLTITFTLHDTQELAVGIRENSFWLSYPRHLVYQGNGTRDALSKTITIPLTDKLADKDGSVDLMFFATSHNHQPTEAAAVTDTTQWELHDLQAEVSFTTPTPPQLKDYVRSQLANEPVL